MQLVTLGEPYIYHDLGVIYKNVGILLEVIFGDTYSITFGDGLVILKPQPNFFSISYLVSHP